MRRMCLILLLLLSGSTASAGACPDFYRFVDFGQTGKDGVVYRGGSFFRAEDFDGTELLDMSRTQCLEVSETNTDGHGYTIPVVSSINYNPERTKVDLTVLQVSSLENAPAAAESSAANHQQRLEQPDIKIIRGDNFLCALESSDDAFSCQIVSPYEGNYPLVIYCDVLQCVLSVMVVNKTTAVTATWMRDSSATANADSAATEVVSKIAQIHGFLAPITSLNPG